MAIIYELVEELKNQFGKYCKKESNNKGVTHQRIIELENEIKKLKEELEKKIAKPSYADIMPNWKNMDETIYPPELHLAMIIWQRIYQNNELEGKHFDGHSSKFKAIANDINLDPKSLLSKRIKTTINPAISKNNQKKLADPLRAIKGLYMSAKKTV